METKRLNTVPGLMYLWEVDNLLIAGQPQTQSFEALKEFGITKVFNMRNSNEMDFSDEIAECERLDLEYINFPLVINGQLDREACDKLSKSIDEKDKWFIHCGSANRIAGWLITHLTKYRGMSFEEACEIAMNNGLTNPAFIEQARDIVG